MFLIFKKYVEKQEREKLIIEELNKRKFFPFTPHYVIITQLTNAFELGEITREFFLGQLDCYMFYCKFPLFKKCFQHASNNQSLPTFEDFFKTVQYIMRKNGRLPHRTPPEQRNVIKIYGWTKIITFNELIVNDDISIILRRKVKKEYQHKIQKKIKNDYLPILHLLVPNVLSEIIVEYIKDFLFLFSCIFPREIVKEERKLIIPTWESINQFQKQTWDFWK